MTECKKCEDKELLILGQKTRLNELREEIENTKCTHELVLEDRDKKAEANVQEWKKVADGYNAAFLKATIKLAAIEKDLYWVRRDLEELLRKAGK
jgi:hypothetical protein